MKIETVKACEVGVGDMMEWSPGDWRRVTDTHYVGSGLWLSAGYSSMRLDHDDVVRVNRHREILTHRIGAPSTVHHSGDEYGSYSLAMVYRTPKDVAARDVWRSAGWLFDRRCQHEHDCCGHYYPSVSGVRCIKPGEWKIRVTYTMNV